MNDVKQGGSNKPKNHVDFKSEFYFQTPIWVAQAPMFIKKLMPITDKYIKKADKLQKETLKKEPKWKKSLGDFGLSKHSESFSNDPKAKEFVDFCGARSFEFLDWQGFDLRNHSLHFTEFWVQEFSRKGGGHHDTHVHWNQHVSGFYFLDCSEKTSVPVIHDPRMGARMTKLPQKDQSKITLASEQIHFKIQPGTMIIIPGYLPHQYIVDNGLDRFRFIHWNIKAVETSISKEKSIK